MDALAAGSRALVGRAGGVAHDHGDSREGDVQLFGNDLRQCCPQSSAELYLARIDGDVATGVNFQPGIDGITSDVARLDVLMRLVLGRRHETRLDGGGDAGFGELWGDCRRCFLPSDAGLAEGCGETKGDKQST